jgi:hypothetical protein
VAGYQSMKTKICKLCKEELSIDNFWKNPSIKDGYFNKCKTCAKNVGYLNSLKKQKYLADNIWTCSSCNKELLLTSEFFYKRTDSETGFQHRCKNCLQKDPNRCDRLIKKDNLDYYIKDRFHGAKNRAISKNIPFDLTIDYLQDLWKSQDGNCKISGLKMTHTILHGKLDTNASIDKINPSLGYVEGNVQFVCNRANMMKSNMPLDNLIYFCKLIIENNEKERFS